MAVNPWQEIVIAFGILFADNSRALVVYSPKSANSALQNQAISQTYRSRRGQPRMTNRFDVKFDQKQLQKKFKHAGDFNVQGNPNKPQLVSYKDNLERHLDGEKIQVIVGTYRQEPVVHYLNPETRTNVIVGEDGYFVSAWKLSVPQFQNVQERGSL